MTHSKIVLAFAAVLGFAAAASIPAGAVAGSYSYGSDDHDHLGWAIVSGGNTSMSDMGAGPGQEGARGLAGRAGPGEVGPPHRQALRQDRAA